MDRLIPLKNSQYVDELCECIDNWKLNPHNRQLLSTSDDKPMFAFADSRAENFNEVLGSVFRYDYYPHDLSTRDFVCLDTDGTVMGYFHCIIAELPGGVFSVSGLRTYRFKGTPLRYGKAQKEFYDWLYDTFDIVTMVVVANSDFAEGKVTIEGDKVSDEMQAIFKENVIRTGFAQPGGFKMIQRYNGVVDRYIGFVTDLDGSIRFLHSFRWLGKRGIAKRLGLPQIHRSEEFIHLLEENGIFI